MKKIICYLSGFIVGICITSEQMNANVIADDIYTEAEVNQEMSEDEYERRFQEYIINTINKAGRKVNDETLWIEKLDYLITDYDKISEMKEIDIKIIDEYIDIYSSHLENLLIWSLKKSGENVDSHTPLSEIVNYLKSDYQNIINNEYAEKEVIDYYINLYETNSNILNHIEEKASYVLPQKVQAKTSYTYVSSRAVAYAKDHGKNINTNYPYWGDNADCANFVSQCLHAGGMQMTDNGNPKSTGSWYSYGTVADVSKVSSTWRGANMFRWYWVDRAKNSYRLYNYQDVFDKAKFGDVISLCHSDGVAYHTMIVVGRKSKNKDLLLAAHSYDTIDAKLSEKMLRSDCSSVMLYSFK